MPANGYIGDELSRYVRNTQPRISGVPRILTVKGQAGAGAITRFDLKVDTLAPFVLTEISISVGEVPYPVVGAMPLFITKMEADVMTEGNRWNRDQLVRDNPYLLASPFGLGGLYGSMPLPVQQVIRPSSVIEVYLLETGGVARNVSIAAHGYMVGDMPQFVRLGDTQYLNPEGVGEMAAAAGRVQVIADRVTILAGSEDDLVFRLGSSERTWLDNILITYDGLPLWNAGLALLTLDVRQILVQFEGMSETFDLIDGTQCNVMNVLGGAGNVGARLFDKSLMLNGGSDIVVRLVNTDIANPHTIDGCAVVHRH